MRPKNGPAFRLTRDHFHLQRLFLQYQCARKTAYPISSLPSLLIPVHAKAPKNGKIIADFLNSMVTDGQKMTSRLSYAPLSRTAVEKVNAAINQVH